MVRDKCQTVLKMHLEIIEVMSTYLKVSYSQQHSAKHSTPGLACLFGIELAVRS